ncbi:MAG: LysM peptidoglycan-binding domain-containing protein [Desulfobacteraceae bacterium]|nr:LysM peptidoglycan-binding domain-containing protein [Desulfobacteraceae bacterium]
MTAAFVLTIMGFVLCSLGSAEENKDFVPGEDSGFYYTIKKGDTLWDLSQKFYNSEWDWPGLWEMNQDIKNPHWIYPGKKIRIFLKENTAVKPEFVKIEEIKPEKPPEKIIPSFSFSEMDRIGFVRKTAEPHVGSVIKDQDNKIMMSSNDIIYIKPSGKGTLIPGNRYHVFSTSPVKTKTFSGIKHILRARIEIREHKTTYATAKVIKAYREIREGDMIMEYRNREPVLTVDESPSPVDGRILCSEDDNIMINDNRIAFIDIGSDHVRPGQIYSVMRSVNKTDKSLWLQNPKSEVKFDNINAGKLIVLHTEDISSTVMILSSKYEINPDDIVN